MFNELIVLIHQFNLIFIILFQIDSKIANHTKSYLEQHLHNIIKPYPLAISTYALMMSNSNFTKKSLTKLQSLSTNQESEFGWPKVHPTSDWYDDVVPQNKGNIVEVIIIIW